MEGGRLIRSDQVNGGALKRRNMVGWDVEVGLGDTEDVGGCVIACSGNDVSWYGVAGR